MKRLCSVILCLCLCACLSSCQKQQSSSGVSDSFLEGIEQGREDFFMDLWDASYNRNTLKCGDLWRTVDFSLLITAKRGISPLLENSEVAPYLEVDFTLNYPSIEECWKDGNLIFSIYSASDEGISRVWDSDYYFDYFYLIGNLNDNEGYTEVRINEGTQILRVIIVIDGCLYTARYYVDV